MGERITSQFLRVIGKKQNKKKTVIANELHELTVLSLSLNVFDRLISKRGPVNNLSNIILVLRHGDSLGRTGRLCTFFRKWIASEAAEMRQRVRRDASHKVSYFPGRLHVGGGAARSRGNRNEQKEAETANWLYSHLVK